MNRLLLLLLLPLSTLAQKLPTIEEKTGGFKRYEGYLPFFWDETSGKIYLDLHRLDSELLFVTSLPAGLGSNDIGLDRGKIGERYVVKFQRVGRKILMIAPNYNFRATAESASERRAAEQSFSQSVLWGFTIEAESGGHALVDATDFMLRDAVGAANRIRNLKQGNYSFDKSRSAVFLPGSKGFPLNTELEASITLVNGDGQTGNFIQDVATDPKAITLRMHYSFVQLPPPGYTPRVFDPRSSFIERSYFDYSTPVAEPIDKYFIIRHRLQKKNPGAARSEPVKPIVYYLDNGTPEPIRSALLEGARWWNEAFEAAGYINAFRVELLPEDADPMDIRYNMINWVHRSTRGWSYGDAVVDPRTGEIIKGNVSLGSLRVRQDYLLAEGLLAPYGKEVPKNDPMLAMALARLRQLSAHEVGHTIGLSHNYAASPSDRASVMDYPHPLVQLKPNGEPDLSKAYATGIGEWDKVAITWGYAEFAPGTNERAQLNKILDDAEGRGLLFISDRDAGPTGLHPTTHLWDNGRNATEELKRVLAYRAAALKRFGENNLREGRAWAFLEDVLVPVYFAHRYQAEAASKLVGGMNYRYAVKGDGRMITQPVPKKDQLQALDALIDCLDPAALRVSESIAKLIPPRPSGYDYTRELFTKRTGLAFSVLGPAETAAALPLNFLFLPERLNRMMEYEHTSGGLGVEELIEKLVAKTWKAPRRPGIEGLIQLQTEQILLSHLLAASMDERNGYPVRIVLRKELEDLKGWIEEARKSYKETQYLGHLLLALDRMKEPEKVKPTPVAAIPPGAPIGCEE